MLVAVPVPKLSAWRGTMHSPEGECCHAGTSKFYNFAAVVGRNLYKVLAGTAQTARYSAIATQHIRHTSLEGNMPNDIEDLRREARLPIKLNEIKNGIVPGATSAATELLTSKHT